MWIGRAKALRENVRDSDAFHYSAHSTTGNDTCTGRCWLHENLASAMLANNRVRDCAARHRDSDHVTASCLDGLADGFGNFVRLASREANAPLTITHGYECIEGETASALNDLGYTIDRDDVLDELAASLAALATASTITSTAWATSATGTTAALSATALATATLAATGATAPAACTTTSAATLAAASALLAAARTRTASWPAAAGVATSAATSAACAAARGRRSTLLLFVSH